LASSDINFFLLSFHCGWIIWGVGAGRKLLKFGGNCCKSERDAGLLFVKDVVRVLRYDLPADVWTVIYASLVGLPSILSSDKLDPIVGVVSFDEFNRSLCGGIKVVSGVRMSWSLIVKVNIFFDVCWEIVLLSPKDLCELVTELSV